MTEKYSISRQKAEIAFSRIHMPFFAKDKAEDEREAVTHARNAKTVRLREARLAKELESPASAASAFRARRAGTNRPSH